MLKKLNDEVDDTIYRTNCERASRVKAHWFWGEQETDPLKPQKVCGKCFDLLLPMQPYLTATLSKAVQAPDYTAPSWKEWAGKPISRSFKLEIKKAVHNLHSFLGMPDADFARKLLDRARGHVPHPPHNLLHARAHPHRVLERLVGRPGHCPGPASTEI